MKNYVSPVVIDIWSDLVCPWCWIAKTRFEKALSEHSYKDNIEVRYHAYRLSDQASAPYIEALTSRYGNPDSINSMMARVREAGAEDGLVYNFENMRFGDTLDAHVLIAAARRVGLGDEMTNHLFYQSTTCGRSIFDRNELRLMAHEVGMQESDIDSVFDNKELVTSVIEDEALARQAGSSGVPFFVFNNKYVMSGASPVEVFSQALDVVWGEYKPFEKETNGLSCDIDGCDS